MMVKTITVQDTISKYDLLPKKKTKFVWFCLNCLRLRLWVTISSTFDQKFPCSAKEEDTSGVRMLCSSRLWLDLIKGD